MTDFISLFSGAGGLDLGLEQAGWDCLFATDHDQAAIDTVLANRGHAIGQGRKALDGTVVEKAKIEHLSGADILSKVGRRKGDVPLLAGGPPCQSWSSGGNQRGFADPRGQLVHDYLRIAKDLEPRYLLFENVRGLLTARGHDGVPGSALAYLRESLQQKGWLSKVSLLNAADFGVPQRRVRLILLGYRAGDEPRFPAASHAINGADGKLPWVTLGQCLSSVQAPTEEEIIRPSGKMAIELADLAPGTGAKSVGKKEATRPGGHWGYKQGAFIADSEKAARTVTASSQQDWIRDARLGLRRLCPRECAAIQTFPEDWVLVGKRLAQYRLIGNAVPPMLGAALGAALAESVRMDAPKVKRNEKLAPLPEKLQAAISYTIKDDLRNGPSRRATGKRKSVQYSELGQVAG